MPASARPQRAGHDRKSMVADGLALFRDAGSDEGGAPSDGTAFTVVGDSNITAGVLLSNGVPKYPIVISLASEAIRDDEIAAFTNYVAAGGFLFVGLFGFHSQLRMGRRVGILLLPISWGCTSRFGTHELGAEQQFHQNEPTDSSADEPHSQRDKLRGGCRRLRTRFRGEFRRRIPFLRRTTSGRCKRPTRRSWRRAMRRLS